MIGYTGKATVYKNITFRSRLEARWAAMFDILEWPWEYEPEIEGTGYIPDFLLHGPHGERVFVEVKPLAVFTIDRKAIIDKVTRAVRGAPVLVVTDQFPDAIAFKVKALGYMINFEEKWDFDHAILFQPGVGARGLEYDFAGEYGSWQGRLSGVYDGNALFEVSQVPSADFLRLWSQAGNAVQWKPPA